MTFILAFTFLTSHPDTEELHERFLVACELSPTNPAVYIAVWFEVDAHNM